MWRGIWCFEKRKFPSPSEGNVLRLRRLEEHLAAVCRKRKASHFELESKTGFQVNSRAAMSLAKFAFSVTCTVPSLKYKYVGKKGYRERPFPEVLLWSNGRRPHKFCAFMKQTFLKWGLQRKRGTVSDAGSIAVYKLALVVWMLWCFWGFCYPILLQAYVSHWDCWKTYFHANWCWFMHRKKKPQNPNDSPSNLKIL